MDAPPDDSDDEADSNDTTDSDESAYSGLEDEEDSDDDDDDDETDEESSDEDDDESSEEVRGKVLGRNPETGSNAVRWCQRLKHLWHGPQVENVVNTCPPTPPPQMCHLLEVSPPLRNVFSPTHLSQPPEVGRPPSPSPPRQRMT